MASPTCLPSVRRPAESVSKSRPVSMVEGGITNIPNLSAISNEGYRSKKSKRMSLLPQFARSVSTEGKDENASIKQDVEDGGGSPRAVPEEKRDLGNLAGIRAIDDERKAIPPASKLSRPVSIIPPRGASQPVMAQSRRTHTPDDSNEKNAGSDAARAQSLAALTGNAPAPTSKLAMPESGLKRTGSTRLPQTSKIGGPAIPSRTTSSRAKHVHSRMTSKRNETTNPAGIVEEGTSKGISPSKVRPTSIIVPNTDQVSDNTSPPQSQRSSVMSRPRPTAEVPQPTSPPRSCASSRPRPLSQIQPHASKPTFNMFQQHYSPAKSALPKAPIPTARTSSMRAPKFTEDAAITFEATKQQVELLQLSLLHQSAGKCMQEYTASARRKLGKKHGRLRKDYESIRATELVHQRAANLSALETWCPDTGLLVENLQILSLVYSDLTSLMEEGSRHGDVVSMFDLWMEEAEAPEPGSFTQPLPDDWRAAHASVTLKLRSIQRNIRVLPASNGDGSSGLEGILRGCKTLVDEMLKELEIMSKLEKEMLAREGTRVENEVKALVYDDVNVKTAWVPAWQTVA